ncbi:MAG: hypothetical protein AB7O97_11370 [Planctomycetota bacterium]
MSFGSTLRFAFVPLLLVWLAFASAARAQELTPHQQALQSVATQLQRAQQDLQAARARTPADEAAVAEQQRQVEQLRGRLVALATGFDVSTDEQGEPQYDLQAELMRLVRPLVRALSSATEGPRQLQELKGLVEQLDRQVAEAELIASGLAAAQQDTATAPGLDPVVAQQLQAAAGRWSERLRELRDERQIRQAQVEQLEGQRAPVAETVQNAVADFFQRRGVSLGLAVLACVLVLLGMRLVHRTVQRVAGRTRVPMRLFDVAFSSLTGVAAAAVVLVVFWLRGDFELLALAIVFLLGLGWALSRTLPMFVEQVRLLLNAGSVREGERLLVDGLPYRVDALRLHSRLVNPELQGGVLRIPLRDLVGRASRKFHHDEPWFPTAPGQWVALDSGTWGRVEVQTPEQVVLFAEFVRKTYRTGDFLAENPRNLSTGFLLAVSFGIDYGLQKDSTGTIPAAMKQALERELPELEGGDALQKVVVEFEQAGASSLDLQARVLFGGGAAHRYGALRRAISRILVDACTAHGWTIPFPQLTVHRAGGTD